MVSGGDVGEWYLGPGVLGLSLLDTTLGSIIVTLLSRRSSTSHMTSYAAKLPYTSNMNITSLSTRSPTGVCFAERLSWFFLEGCSEKIGGPNRTFEIDERKFGRRKYHQGHPVRGQWVFGGVERESGRTFRVPVPDRTADTLVNLIRAWVEPVTTIISDCWAAYRQIDCHGYTPRNVNYSVSFVNPATGDHTNTIEACGVQVRNSLNPTTVAPIMNIISPTTRRGEMQGAGCADIQPLPCNRRGHGLGTLWHPCHVIRQPHVTWSRYPRFTPAKFLEDRRAHTFVHNHFSHSYPRSPRLSQPPDPFLSALNYPVPCPLMFHDTIFWPTLMLSIHVNACVVLCVGVLCFERVVHLFVRFYVSFFFNCRNGQCTKGSNSSLQGTPAQL
jgi:transposase-like protein